MLSVSYRRVISQLNADATRLVALLHGRLRRVQRSPRRIRFSPVLNRNANVSNHRKEAYAGQVGCAILVCNKKSKYGV